MLEDYYTDEDVNDTAMFTLYFIASTLSLIGSGLIILSYIFIKDLRRFPYTIVFFLSLCDFFFSLKFFISAVYLDNIYDIPPGLCTFQGTSYRSSCAPARLCAPQPGGNPSSALEASH